MTLPACWYRLAGYAREIRLTVDEDQSARGAGLRLPPIDLVPVFFVRLDAVDRDERRALAARVSDKAR